MTDPAFDSWLGHLPSHWIRTRFGQDVVINEGQVDPTKEPWSSMVLVAPNHIESGTGRIISLETACDQGADSGKYRAKCGQVLYSKIRPALNKVAIAPVDCLCSADMYPISGRRHAVDNRFLAYWMLARPFVAYATLMSDRVKMPKVNREEVAAAPWTRPPLDEQRRISDFLDAETTRIDQLAELQNSVRATVQARVVAQLDLKFDELTETYGAIPFRRSIWSIEQGVSPQCDNFPAGPDDWGVLKVSAVKNGTFVEDENKQLPAQIEPESRYEIKKGDLLITRANTPLLVGAAAVAESPRQKLMLCDKIFRVITTRDLMPEFLVLASLSTKIRDMCAEASHGTSQSMANLKTEEIKSWPVPKAPADVQRAVVVELSAARNHAKALIGAIDRQLAILAERRQALITAAVTGEITV
jgi:restriction endonuclease S subunit